MGSIIEVFFNPVLAVSVIAWFIAQTLKFLINGMVHKKFTFSRFVGDGGMPSAHSATVVALTCTTAMHTGFSSVEFAITVILAIIVMHDASGVRRETGKQTAAIKSMVGVINDYIAERDEKIKTEKLKDLVGHTNLQVVCGALLGFLVSLGYYFIFIY